MTRRLRLRKSNVRSFRKISTKAAPDVAGCPTPHHAGIVKLRILNMRRVRTAHRFVGTFCALLLALSSGTASAAQAGLSEGQEAAGTDAAADEGSAEVHAEQLPAPHAGVSLSQPFVSPTAARSMARLALLAVLLRDDRQTIEEWDRGNQGSADSLHLELPNVTISSAIATRLLRTLRESEDDSEQRNAVLAIMLLTKPEQVETRLLTIRALSQELARLRGEPPRPMMIVAIATFALNQTDAIARTDPRHRIGLLEALIEIRDFAGVERATRGYEGHSLQSLLTPYRRAIDFDERRVDVSEAVAEQLGHPEGASLLMGMYHDEAGDLVWISE